jgi:hypothetical protein
MHLPALIAGDHFITFTDVNKHPNTTSPIRESKEAMIRPFQTVVSNIARGGANISKKGSHSPFPELEGTIHNSDRGLQSMIDYMQRCRQVPFAAQALKMPARQTEQGVE